MYWRQKTHLWQSKTYLNTIYKMYNILQLNLKINHLLASSGNGHPFRLSGKLENEYSGTNSPQCTSHSLQNGNLWEWSWETADLYEWICIWKQVDFIKDTKASTNESWWVPRINFCWCTQTVYYESQLQCVWSIPLGLQKEKQNFFPLTKDSTLSFNMFTAITPYWVKNPSDDHFISVDTENNLKSAPVSISIIALNIHPNKQFSWRGLFL